MRGIKAVIVIWIVQFTKLASGLWVWEARNPTDFDLSESTQTLSIVCNRAFKRKYDAMQDWKKSADFFNVKEWKVGEIKK